MLFDELVARGQVMPATQAIEGGEKTPGTSTL